MPPLAPGADPVANARTAPRALGQTTRQVLADGARGPIHDPVWLGGQESLAPDARPWPDEPGAGEHHGWRERLLPRDRVGGATVGVLNPGDGAAELHRTDPQGSLTRLTSFNQ